MRIEIKEIEQLKGINDYYDLSNDKLNEGIENMNEAILCTPLIGKFSSGKSTLLNTVLGYRLLKENILPETAIPTEIVYREDETCEIYSVDDNSEKTENCTVKEFATNEYNINNISKVKLYLNNENLSSIQDIMLVDMPGFESGIEVHNKAIDGYLDKSLAYIILFQANDMTLRTSMINILKELNLYDTNIIFVITKSELIDEKTLNDNLINLKENLAKHITISNIEFVTTSSFNKEIANFKEMLEDLQSKSRDILTKKYVRMMMENLNNTEIYIKSKIKSNSLSESELDAQIDEYNANLKKTDEELQKINTNFMKEVGICTSKIMGNVSNALNAATGTLTSLALNDMDIAGELNTIVRTSVVSSTQSIFIPIVKKYVDKVSSDIDLDYISVGNISTKDSDSSKSQGGEFVLDKGTINSMMGVISSTISTLFVAIPVVNILVGIVGSFISSLFGSSGSGESSRSNKKSEISNQLNSSVFPSVIEQVRGSLERELSEKPREVQDKIAETFDERKAIILKALEEAKVKLNDEKEQKELELQQLNKHLEELESIKNAY